MCVCVCVCVCIVCVCACVCVCARVHVYVYWLQESFSGHSNYVHCVCLRSGGLLLSGSEDGTVKMWGEAGGWEGERERVEGGRKRVEGGRKRGRERG